MNSLCSLGLLLSLTTATTLAGATAPAQTRPAPTASSRVSYQFLQMTTIESIVPGGLGRSRIVFTPDFKGTKEATMENLFSLVGINLSNVRANEETILRYLGEISTDGWELMQITPLTQTIQGAGGQSQQGIFLTRYLFRKAK